MTKPSRTTSKIPQPTSAQYWLQIGLTLLFAFAPVAFGLETIVEWGIVALVCGLTGKLARTMKLNFFIVLVGCAIFSAGVIFLAIIIPDIPYQSIAYFGMNCAIFYSMFIGCLTMFMGYTKI